MPGDEEKSINRAETMLGRPLSLRICLYRQCISQTTTRRGTNKIPKCFSFPGDCKELSKTLSEAHTT